MDFLNDLLSTPDVLTPAGVYEMFGLFCVIELIGMLFSWIRGGK